MTSAIATPAGLEAQRALLEARFPQWLVSLPCGARLAIRQRGERNEAPTLVLLHGISSGAASWLHAVDRLPPGQHVLAWDAPGYGHSTPLTPGAPRAADYAARLDELLRALEVQRCVLVGHSLGALVACAYAARAECSAHVERLVLISPARGYGGDAVQAERVRAERSGALQAAGVAGLAARIDQRLLSPAADEAARAWVRWNAERLQPAGYLQAVQMLCNSELALPPRGLPLEVHCGEADVVTPPAACAELAARFGAPFRTIANAGHASPIEQPAAVAALLAQSTRTSQGETHHA
jgi:pimeloyl-ACP methyl ester carboxylesterase